MAAELNRPFLSIVTRCYQRPTMLEANRESVCAQTDPDFEHILIIDREGAGLHAANQALASAMPAGEYVLILDDDDVLSDPEAIEVLKQAAADEPALVIFRADHDILGVLPKSAVWGRRPVRGGIGSCDFITRRDWWENYIGAFGVPKCGDFVFLNTMWQADPSVVWLDRQLAAVQRISHGRPEYA